MFFFISKLNQITKNIDQLIESTLETKFKSTNQEEINALEKAYQSLLITQKNLTQSLNDFEKYDEILNKLYPWDK